jgi:hypothetical protein
VRDFAFYNAGIDEAKGPKRVLGLARRALRRILRPMFFHQEAIYRDLQGQIDQLSAQIETLSGRLSSTDAFGWDYVAMARRLAAIEDHLIQINADVPASIGQGHRIDPGLTDGLSSPNSTLRPMARNR